MLSIYMCKNIYKLFTILKILKLFKLKSRVLLLDKNNGLIIIDTTTTNTVADSLMHKFEYI
jgi:hypothetical protein